MCVVLFFHLYILHLNDPMEGFFMKIEQDRVTFEYLPDAQLSVKMKGLIEESLVNFTMYLKHISEDTLKEFESLYRDTIIQCMLDGNKARPWLNNLNGFINTHWEGFIGTYNLRALVPPETPMIKPTDNHLDNTWVVSEYLELLELWIWSQILSPITLQLSTTCSRRETFRFNESVALDIALQNSIPQLKLGGLLNKITQYLHKQGGNNQDTTITNLMLPDDIVNRSRAVYILRSLRSNRISPSTNAIALLFPVAKTSGTIPTVAWPHITLKEASGEGGDGCKVANNSDIVATTYFLRKLIAKKPMVYEVIKHRLNDPAYLNAGSEYRATILTQVFLKITTIRNPMLIIDNAILIAGAINYLEYNYKMPATAAALGAILTGREQIMGYPMHDINNIDGVPLRLADAHTMREWLLVDGELIQPDRRLLLEFEQIFSK